MEHITHNMERETWSKKLFKNFCSMFHASSSMSCGGYSLIEILIAIGVFSAIIFGVVGIFIVSQESVQIARNKTKAVRHLTDYVEKIKNIKRHDWTSLANGRYVFVDNAGNWEFQPTTDGETVYGFTRYLEIADAYRDGSISGPLVSGPGILDPSSKQVTVAVSWGGLKPGSITESTYITRYLDNLPWENRTAADFDAGTHNGTTTVNEIDGEVVLGAGGGASWCAPSLNIAGLNLPKSGVATSVTAIEGRAFAGTGENASGESFVNVNISNTKPPVATILGTMNGYKTNDVFGETNYGYIATDTNSAEVVIIDISSTPYTVVGTLDTPGVADAESVFVYGNTGYVITGSVLYNFDVTDKSAPVLIDTVSNGAGVTLSGLGRAVVVVGDYAYVATAGTQRLQIISLADPTNLTVVGYANLNSAPARDVYVNQSGTRAYVATESSANQREVFIVDVTSKIGEQPVIGSYDTNGMSPRGIEAVPGGRVIVVGIGGEEYQVLNTSDETNPVRCGGMQVDSGIFDSASILESDNDAYTYIVTGDANSELKIIEGGPGGQFSTSGIWESATFDTGHSTAFNRFEANFDEPFQTDIRFQVAIVDPGASGTCTDANFSNSNFIGPGPDGTGNSAYFFQSNGPIPFDDDGVGYENPGQCARVRAYLETSDYGQTPILYDISINYSP